MEKEQFYNKLAEILETEAVKDEEVLREFEVWDSLTVLSIIAMADSDYKINISSRDLDSVTTVGDLKAYLENHNK